MEKTNKIISAVMSKGYKTWKVVSNRWFVLGFILLSVTIATAYGLVQYGEWSLSWKRIWQLPVVVKLQVPTYVAKREPVYMLSPLAEEVINPLVKDMTPIEKKICDKWGAYECKTALAVFRCESGLRKEAVNWETKDIGTTQINWPIWEKPIKEKFGYTLVDMFDEDKNLEVAYWIYDRGDGTEGDGMGNYSAWVAFTSGSFRGCMR